MAFQKQPTSVFLAICNEIIEDSVTRNKTLVSLFDKIGVDEFPSTHQRTGVIVSLQGVAGDVTITIAIKSPKGEKLISLDGKANNPDPLRSLDFAMNIAGLHLPEPGIYTLEASSEGELLGQRFFSVVPLSELGINLKASSPD